MPPLGITIALGLQFVVLLIAGIILIPTVVVQAAGEGPDYLSWALFASMAMAGLMTVFQAFRIGCIGSGYIILMGGSTAFMAMSITALIKGGPTLLAALVATSALIPLMISSKLSLLRKILTPAVSGTVLMLIPVTMMSVIFDMLTKVPKGAFSLSGPMSAFVTLAVIITMALSAKGIFRLCGPVIGIIIGSIVASFFGLYDIEKVIQASWLGFPEGSWPGLNLEFSKLFWQLLPSFVLVALIDIIHAVSNSVAIQRVSWKEERATNFRDVQGTLTASGIGNFICGLLGVIPNSIRPTSVSVTELTGVASRSVGVATGLILIVLAFFPKAVAVVLAIPGPVVAAYLLTVLSLLFVTGMKYALQGEIDNRNALIVGVSFCIGIGFQNGLILPDYVEDFAGGILNSAMTAGGLVAIIMTLSTHLIGPRRHRIEMACNSDAFLEVQGFLDDFVARSGWGDAMRDRIKVASEEMLLILLWKDWDKREEKKRRLILKTHKENEQAILEFITIADQGNIQDRIALLEKETTLEFSMEKEISLRLLNHVASSVRHEQYHDIDIVTIKVEGID
ncbi:MAG: hypothetical protein OXB88_04935 [Bacteriovoracales bacterium]|nr:hypothetical protein [Bacteriovoracales bacterium]